MAPAAGDGAGSLKRSLYMKGKQQSAAGGLYVPPSSGGRAPSNKDAAAGSTQLPPLVGDTDGSLSQGSAKGKAHGDTARVAGGGGAAVAGSLRPRMLPGMVPKRGGYTAITSQQPTETAGALRLHGSGGALSSGGGGGGGMVSVVSGSSALMSGRPAGSHFDSAIASPDARPRPMLPPAGPPAAEAHRSGGAVNGRMLKRSLSAGTTGGSAVSDSRQVAITPRAALDSPPFTPDSLTRHSGRLSSPGIPPHDATTIEPVMLRPMWEHNNSRRLASPGAGSTRSVSAPTAASVTASERVGGVGELRSSAEGLPDADKSEEDILGPIRSWYSFMNLLRSAKAPKEFVYLRAVPVESPHYTGNPYDLDIVAHSQIDKRDFYTMSALGVTHFTHGAPEFTPLDQWEREYFLYKQIASLSVFKNFRKWKGFVIMKQAVRAKKQRNSREQLERSLFILDDMFRRPMLRVREECWKLQQLRLHSMQPGALYTLQEFQAAQAAQAEVAQERLTQFSDFVTSITQRLCHRVIEALEKELFGEDNLAMRGLLQPGAQQRFAAAKKLLDNEFSDDLSAAGQQTSTAYSAMLSQGLGSSTNRPANNEDGIKFSYAITVARRARQRKLLSFIRLADYMIANTLHRVLLDSMADMLRILAPPALPPTVEPYTPLTTPETGLLRLDSRVVAGASRTGAFPSVAHSLYHALSAQDSVGAAALRPEERTVFQLELLVEPGGGALVYQPSTSAFESAIFVALDSFVGMLGLVARLRTHANVAAYLDMGPTASATEVGESGLADIIVDEEYHRAHEKIESSAVANFQEVEGFKGTFSHALDAMRENAGVTLDGIRGEVMEGSRDLAAFRADILKYTQQASSFGDIHDAVPLGILQINLRRLRATLQPGPTRCLHIITTYLPRLSADKYNSFNGKIRKAMDRLLETPQSVNDFVLHIHFLKGMESKRKAMDAEYDEVSSYYELMAEFKIPVPEMELAAYKTMEADYHALNDQLAYCIASQEGLVQHFKTDLEEEIDRLNKTVVDVRLMAMNEMVLDAHSEQARAMNYLKPLVDKISREEEHAKRINSQQNLFGLSRTKFTELAEVSDDVRLKYALWESQMRWDVEAARWRQARFSEIKLDDLEETVSAFSKQIIRLERGLPPNKVVPLLRERISKWKDLVPIVQHLRNGDLKERHWVKVEEILGAGLEQPAAAASVTVGHLLGMNVMEARDLIVSVSTEASQEAALEAMLKKVQDRWATAEFTVNQYKDYKDMYILGSVEDIMGILDDSTATMANITSSRYVDGIRGEVSRLENSLRLFSNTLDEWLECQKNWVYLESIFSAPDIQRQLPHESKSFLFVDRLFKDVMRRTKERPVALPAATAPGLLETLQKCNESLEHVQHNLEAYLEVKRSEFPRFYFLSNDALLEILSQTKNPQAVQPHLQKCFDGIVSLEFGAALKSIDILAMVGVEGERVPLGRNLKARGNVEAWLAMVEHNMRQSLQALAKKGWKDYSGASSRLAWIKAQPAQLALVVNNIYWVADVEEALADEVAVERLEQLHEYLVLQLNDLCSEVRSNMPVLLRKVVVAMVTIEVHNRDIVESLAKQGVSSATDFAWQRQLRYYYDAEYDQVTIRQSTAVFSYGLEYLGAQPRLVVTPMTDRCYMTLTGALHMKLGGAPTGPAGTGKTETTKDLGRALGVQCVVFNCAENLDYKFMAKFFSGLAQCGAWACFDEFNRIDVEVLSVVAQQLLTIQNALRAHAPHFVFEGKQIALVPSCGVIITQNPGYVGRSELPDNLKALFRPVSMMIPDYALVAEVMLFSEGFLKAKPLSRKMVMLYKLSSEQLSQQDHYDFGLRALKSVLVMAGTLKRQSPTTGEDLVLIRAMRDANIPKFLSEDAELFSAIVGDLFPDLAITPQDYGDLQRAVVACAKTAALQPIPSFVLKVVQLFETFNVRFGVMLVGPSGGGKTSVYRTLVAAMTVLRAQGHKDAAFQTVQLDVLFPKAVNIGELYGEYNALTSEWTDGLVSTLVRAAVADSSPDLKWTVFDGPVDALWIESMNTVLDDTCTLCLPNGERIKLNSATMRMLFEVKDLSKASPATVSRCGMVYIPADVTGWKPFVQSWLARLPADMVDIAASDVDSGGIGSGEDVTGDGVERAAGGGGVVVAAPVASFIMDMFDLYIDRGLAFVRAHCSEPLPTADISAVTTLTTFLAVLLHRLHAYEPSAQAEMTVAQLSSYDLGGELVQTLQIAIEHVFCFAFIWGIGGAIASAHWDKFDGMVREMFGGRVNFPHTPGLVFDYFLDPAAGWIFAPWDNLVPAFHYSPSAPFHTILVPTVDTTRYSYMLDLALAAKRSVLLTGGSGVGKTRVMAGHMSAAEPRGFVRMVLNFSAQTTSRAAQAFVEGKLEKKRKNRYSAPRGKHCLLFVDDVNMPAPEEYGAQPPIELLRQYQDLGGFYDRKKLYWRSIEGLTVMAACAPPGGGRQELCSRFLRHFSVICMPPPSEVAMRHIFTAIMSGHIEPFPTNVHHLVNPIVVSSVDLFLQLSSELLPIPAKSHYTFNLRDLSKVFQGILLLRPSRVEACGSAPRTLMRLWVHETMRVFHDRLNNSEDRLFYKTAVHAMCRTRFAYQGDLHDLFDATPIIFANFLAIGAAEEDRLYEEVGNPSGLPKLLGDYQEEYNHAAGSSPTSLVFFAEAVDHVSRIARILAQPRGHAMIVGVSGCGKQSLARFAAFIAEYSLFQLEMSRGYGHAEFREDLKRLYHLAGVEGQAVVFLLTDKQLLGDGQVEDVSNMLNSGDVLDLFQPDELDQVFAELRPFMGHNDVPDGRDAMYEAFIDRVRDNLHIVLCMSPVGDNFRDRCRRFPALLNSCTVDWFSEWPAAALHSVSHLFVTRSNFDELQLTDTLADMFVDIHTRVSAASDRFYQELRRNVYITPKSFLDLVQLYLDLYDRKKEEKLVERDRLTNGLNKLRQTNEVVARMKAELDDLKPILHERSRKTQELLATVTHEREEAANILRVVAREEEEVMRKTRLTQELKDDAQQDLEAALPALHAAMKSLQALNKNDITEIKSFSKPPYLVQLTMEGVCILFTEKPDWDSAKRVLSDQQFVRRLMEFDRDHIPDSVVRRLRRVVDDPEFTPEQVQKHSNAARSMCLWVRAMETYAKVIKVVAPKRAALAEAETSLANMEAELQNKRDHLASVNAQVEELQANLTTTQADLQDLQTQVNISNERLSRAVKLTTALAEESNRWIETAENITANMSLLIGDVFLAAAVTSYLGAFTGPYREELIQRWSEQCRQLEIPISSKFNFQAVMASPLEVREWTMQGLPTDSISIDNAVLVCRGQRWPLMIDPQSQANHWIKAKEARNSLQVLNYNDGTLMEMLEGALKVGRPVLVEDFGEELDSALEPLLNRQLYKQGDRMMIKLGDVDVEYNMDFKFYMTTTLPNPHFLPEVFIRANVINFTVTRLGLEDQLLGFVVRRERPQLEEAKDRLVVSLSNDKRQLKDLEDKILKLLEESTGNILDDEVLINTLNTSKLTSAVIKGRVKEAEATEREIRASREEFRPVPVRGCLLYFVIVDLASVDSMYQYSLKYFTQLFNFCLREAEGSDDLATRLLNLQRHLTSYMYRMVCRGLFDTHKAVFSFLIATSLQRAEGIVSSQAWNFLLRGGRGEPSTANPAPDWISPASWQNIAALADVSGAFTHLPAAIQRAPQKWREWAESGDPYHMPTPLGDELQAAPGGGFLRLLLIKLLCENKMAASCVSYVDAELGREFAETPATNVLDVFRDTTKATPIIYILSSGVDPTPILQRFSAQAVGERGGADFELHIISLGQGQGPIAETTIRKACGQGHWVCLQNCHLAKSWMPTLESIVDELQHDEEVHEDFRLWLTSMPSEYFPVSVLQTGVKITMEPPQGLRANLQRSYANMPNNFLTNSRKPVPWRQLAYTLSFFHAVIQERSKFGPLGWNISYGFSDGDLSCALETLQMFLDLPQVDIPWQALMYVLGEINYGGRVTDENDRRLLRCMLKNYVDPKVLRPGHRLCPGDAYHIPPDSADINDYLLFIRSLPATDPPALFGMHHNANIAFELSSSRKLIETVLHIQPRVAADSTGKTETANHDTIVLAHVRDMRAELPQPLDKEMACFARNPFAPLSSRHANSLATVLTQEMARFNRLLATVVKTLRELELAVQGLVVMSPDLDAMYSSVLNNQVPNLWAAVSYASLRPLASWVVDFRARFAFFGSWIRAGQPAVFWMPAFFFPQGFLTATLQNHARRMSIPIDQLSFRFHFLRATEDRDIQGEPPDGVLVKGLYLEGAAWDLPSARLVNSSPGLIYSQLPIIHFSPEQQQQQQQQHHDAPPTSLLYQCPLYKTAVRAGTLSTTGQSTNFVLHINLPIQAGTTPDMWVMQGVAALCAPVE